MEFGKENDLGLPHPPAVFRLCTKRFAFSCARVIRSGYSMYDMHGSVIRCVWCDCMCAVVRACDVYDMLYDAYGMLASSVTSSRCIMSGVALCRAPCRVLVLVMCRDLVCAVCWSPACCRCRVPIRVCMYYDTIRYGLRMYTYYDTIRGAQRSVYSNAYSTSLQS